MAFASSTLLRFGVAGSRLLVCTRHPRRFRVPSRAQLDLGGAAGGTPLAADPHDRLLGELMFCEPDNFHKLVAARSASVNAEFYQYIDDKHDATLDLEERESLSLLKAAVQQVHAEVTAKPKSPTAKADERESQYDELIDSFLESRSRESGLKATVSLQYERVDMEMLNRLQMRQEAAQCDAERQALEEVTSSITNEMSERVNAAVTRLREVISAPGGMDAMKKRLELVAEGGGLDDAFIMLLQSNMERAADAGTKGQDAARALGEVLRAANEIKDRKLPAEIRLVRKLLRADGQKARVALLMEALTPGKKVAMVGGGMSAGVRVDGKQFVEALRELIAKYGNVDKAFVKRLIEIGEESEAVARKIYGIEDKDVKELQEEAFHKRRVSVWDLENVEISEEAQGRKAGWEGSLGYIPPGFNEEGKMTI